MDTFYIAMENSLLERVKNSILNCDFAYELFCIIYVKTSIIHGIVHPLYLAFQNVQLWSFMQAEFIMAVFDG